MGFQFVHVSVYAREKSKKQSKGKDKKWTVRDIAGEVERQPENSSHVPKPQEPTVVWGMKASAAIAEAERRAEASKDVSGRKIRKDTPIVLAGVASHPATVDQLADPATNRSYEEWRHDTLEWLTKKYGNDLFSVVEHTDEKHPHLHFYVVPKAGAGFNAKRLHDGFKAAQGMKSGPEQQRLYCDGMRALQDDFFAQVGAKHQQARIGPRKRRLSRSEWLQEQQQLAQLSKLMRAGKVTLTKAKQQATAIVERAKADSQRLGVKLGAFFGGAAGNARDALRRAERQRDEERLKRQVEQHKRAKAERQAEDVRRRLVHERLTGDRHVENLVAMRLAPLEKQLEIESRKHVELAQRSQVQATAAEQQGPKGPKPL